MTSAGSDDREDRDGVSGGRNGSDGHNGHRPLRRLDRPVFSRTPLTPDQGCYGCLIGLAVLLVTFLVWGFIYWYNEPDFHDPGVNSLAPTAQERLHQRINGSHPGATTGAAPTISPGKSL